MSIVQFPTPHNICFEDLMDHFELATNLEEFDHVPVMAENFLNKGLIREDELEEIKEYAKAHRKEFE